MSTADREKWERKYREKPKLLQPRPPSVLLERYYRHAQGRKALDLACGNGRNALFLAQNGFEVDALDISTTALEHLEKQSKGLMINCIQADLDHYTPPQGLYDLLIMTNYLDRELIKRSTEKMKPGAFFFIETYMIHPENEKKDSNPDFLLAPGELNSFFEEVFEKLAYEEFWNEPHELYRMRKQGIVVQKLS